MKKKIVSLALAVCLIAIAAVGTLAYFTDKTETKVNTFTFGNVNITLTEPEWKQPETVQPGQTYAKDPTITNVGANDAWVRMDVTVSDWAAFKALAVKYADMNDLTNMFKGFKSYEWTLAGVTENGNDTATYAYYYNTKLAKNATATLFESVAIPSYLTAADMNTLQGSFDISVTAYAVQAEGFDTAAAAFADVTTFETID